MPISRIKTDGIQDDAVTSAKIGVDVIVADDLAANSVTVSELTDGAVTSAKLDTNIAVTGTLTAAGDMQTSGEFKANGGVVINEDSLDVDFRVESNGNANTLFVDGGNDRVGIGTSSPSKELHVKGDIDVEGGTGGVAVLRFKAEEIHGTVEGINIGNNFGGLAFKTNNNGTVDEKVRIDNSGNLLVGKTASGIANNGIELRANNDVLITADGATTLYLNRKSSDGEIIEFRKDGTGIGAIGALGGRMYAGSGDVGVFFDSTNNMITPYSLDAGDTVDNTIDLGYSTRRFKDLYLAGGMYVGGTGSANYLDDYEEGTWTPAFVSTGTQPTINYNAQDGDYTKIGRLVTLNFGFNTASVSGGSGELRISGLPFSQTSGTRGGSRAGNVQHWNSSVDASIGGFISGSQIILAKNNDTRIQVSDLRTTNDSNQMWWSLSYLTDA